MQRRSQIQGRMTIVIQSRRDTRSTDGKERGKRDKEKEREREREKEKKGVIKRRRGKLPTNILKYALNRI